MFYPDYVQVFSLFPIDKSIFRCKVLNGEPKTELEKNLLNSPNTNPDVCAVCNLRTTGTRQHIMCMYPHSYKI